MAIPPDAPRQRLRAHGINIGVLPCGPLNAITDVPGVRVGHVQVIRDAPHVARTGITVVYPGPGGKALDAQVFAGVHMFNGYGEMSGAHWLREGGLLSSPICLTSTFSLGMVRDALLAGRFSPEGPVELQPLVAETNDGLLSDGRHPALTPAHLDAALAAAASGPVAEGNVGGGTGMICHGWKGGIGTASRRVGIGGKDYIIGALVQANHGRPEELVIAGHPVGRRLPSPVANPPPGSIIGIVATDAPLLPNQCARLARRAALGMGRCGGIGANGSGDLFLAFSTANSIPPARAGAPVAGLSMLPNAAMDPLFAAVPEAVEEAILNALCMSRTMRGRDGAQVPALDMSAVLTHIP
jgi:D-aminopeptidase